MTCLVFKTTCIDRRIPLREGAFFFTRRTLFPPLDKRNTRDKAKGLCITSERHIPSAGWGRDAADSGLSDGISHHSVRESGSGKRADTYCSVFCSGRGERLVFLHPSVYVCTTQASVIQHRPEPLSAGLHSGASLPLLIPLSPLSEPPLRSAYE